MQAIKQEKFRNFQMIIKHIMLLFDRDHLGAALAMISQCCLEEDLESKEDLFLILGYLTQDIQGYFEAIHSRNRQVLKAMLEVDRRNRQRELECASPPDEQILAFAQSKTDSVVTKFDQLIASLASPKDESRDMVRTRFFNYPLPRFSNTIFTHEPGSE